MPDWTSPAEIQKDGFAFLKLMHVLFGLFIWEWFTTLSFDWQFITGQRKLRWPMLFYFINRYSLLFSFVGIIIALNVTSEINCQALYTYNTITGNFAIGTTSINLALRTMAVWSHNRYVVVPLVLVILGHWSLLLQGFVIKAAWVPPQGCVIIGTNTTLISATFIYSMSFDFLVLILTAYKLYLGSRGRSRLTNLIFGDGLIYFLIAFVANLIATTFMLLDLNPVMSIIFNVPAAIASSIVACRAVRRLSTFDPKGAEVFGSSLKGSTVGFRSPTVSGNKPANGVHVHIEMSEHHADKSFMDLSAQDASAERRDEKRDIESMNGS